MAKARQQRGGLPPDRYLCDSEVSHLLQYLHRQTGRRAAMNLMIIETLLGSGLRAAELCALEIRNLPCCHNKPVIYVRDGKGHVSRTIEISHALSQRLRRYVEQYRRGAKPGAAVFRSEAGYRKLRWTQRRRAKLTDRVLELPRAETTSRLSYRALLARIRRVGRLAGLGRLTPHMLRHTYATMLYGVKEDLGFVRDQLGHVSPTTTMIYARTSPASRRSQVAGLETALFEPQFGQFIGKVKGLKCVAT